MQKIQYIIFTALLAGSLSCGAGLGWADTPVATPQVTPETTPAVTPTPVSQARIEVIQGEEKGSPAAVHFINAEGEISKEIQLNGRVLTAFPSTSDTTYYIVQPKLGIIITCVKFRNATRDEIIKLHDWLVWNNTIEYFNVKGDFVFRKENVNYSPRIYSKDGKSIICFYEGPASMDFAERIGAEKINEKIEPLKDKVIVLSQIGDSLFEEEESEKCNKQFLISPNSKWMIYEVTSGFRLVNLTTHKIALTILQNRYFWGSFIFLYDDAKILFIKRIEPSNGKGAKFATSKYDPFTDSFEKIGDLSIEEVAKCHE